MAPLPPSAAAVATAAPASPAAATASGATTATSTSTNNNDANGVMTMIVSTVLADFFDANPPQTVVATSQILQTLLQNAAATSSGTSGGSSASSSGGGNVDASSNNDNQRRHLGRRVIRLSNPKIQQHVVNVPGALDILGLAGFQRQEELQESSSSFFSSSSTTIGQAAAVAARQRRRGGEGGGAVLVYEPASAVTTNSDNATTASTTGTTTSNNISNNNNNNAWEMYLLEDDKKKESDPHDGGSSAVKQSSLQQQQQQHPQQSSPQQQQQQQQQALIETLCQGLQAQIDQLQPTLLQILETSTTTTPTTTASSSSSSSAFLGEEERQRRQTKARLLRKTKHQERALEQQRWLQDKEQRKEAAEKKQRLKRQLPSSSSSAVAGGGDNNGDDEQQQRLLMATKQGIFVAPRKQSNISLPLAKPMEPAAGLSSDPQAQRAQLVAAARANREKWLQLQQQHQQNVLQQQAETQQHVYDDDDDDDDEEMYDEEDDDDMDMSGMGIVPKTPSNAAYYSMLASSAKSTPATTTPPAAEEDATNKDTMDVEQPDDDNGSNKEPGNESFNPLAGGAAVVADAATVPKKKPPPPSQHVPLSAVVAAMQQQHQHQGADGSSSSTSSSIINSSVSTLPAWKMSGNINPTSAAAAAAAVSAELGASAARMESLGDSIVKQYNMMNQQMASSIPSTNGSGGVYPPFSVASSIPGTNGSGGVYPPFSAFMDEQVKNGNTVPRKSVGGGLNVPQQKTPPPPPPTTFTTDESWSWEECMQYLPPCEAAEGIRETSVYNKGGAVSDSTMPTTGPCLKRIYKELDSLNDSLPTDSNSSIWIRFDEETPQFLRALMAAPLPGPTPYSGGMFVFDIYIPGDYPAVPPKVTLCTTGGGRVRFGPNLYANGKVCLSLLGTWSGPKWNPKHSSLYQVLISIQGLILGVEHPYFLEPGEGGWEGEIKQGQYQMTNSKGQTLDGQVVQQKVEMGVPQQAVQYEDTLRIGSVKFAMMDILKSTTGAVGVGGYAYLKPFYLPIQAHFYQNRNEIVKEVHSWQSDSVCGRKRPSHAKATLQIDQLSFLLPKLQDLLAQIEMPKLQGASAELPSSSSVTTNPIAPHNTTTTITSVDSDGDSKKPAAVTKVDDNVAMNDNENQGNTGNKDLDVLEPKRARMREAAQRGDYVLAGELQGEIARVEDVYRKMQEAAKQQDYMRAGRLQAQFKSLTGQDDPPKTTAAVGAKRRGSYGPTPPYHSAVPGAYDDDYDEDEDDYSDGYEDDNMGGQFGASIPPPFGFPGLGNMLLGPPPPPALGFMAPFMGSVAASLPGLNWTSSGSGFMLFCKEHHARVKEDNPDITFGAIGKMLEEMWLALSEDEKQAYKDSKTIKPAPGPTPPLPGFGFGAPFHYGAMGSAGSGPSNPPTTTSTTDHNILSNKIKKGASCKSTAWGTGNKLGDDSQSASAAAEAAAYSSKPAANQLPKSGQAQPAKNTIPPDQICRLRIRLPNNKTVLEDFDKTETLSCVYRRLQPLLAGPDSPTRSSSSNPSMPAPKVARAGAFAQPLSMAGFTLLLTYPKREFSLELHGTKTLVELNLAPSATLTVMRCSDRGVMHRGELESRLRQAHGNAMDLDGLSYESLVELTDRVGVAGPSDGSAFLGLSAEDLDKNSFTFSPALYLSEPENGRNCPICLGSYDVTDETDSLRELYNCAHVFHTACLETWLKTKPSCPLCKTGIVADEEQP